MFIFSKAKKPPIRQALSPAEKEAKKLQKQIEKELMGTFQAIQNEVPLKDLVAALTRGDMNEVLSIVDVKNIKTTFKGLEDYVLEGITTGGKLAAKELKQAFFDPQGVRVKKWVTEHTANLVKETYGTSLAGVKRTVKAGIKAGRHPMKLSKDVVKSIGLTEPQAIALENRNTWLNKKVEKGTMTEARATTLSDKYSEQLLKKRSEVIARNESLTAVNQGRLEHWQQLNESGAFPKNQMQEWDSAKDMARCPLCAAMHGQKRKIGEAFEGPDGTSVLAPPLHVQCRCVTNLIG